MLTIILGGWGSANWLAFMLPFVLLLIIVKTGEWLNKWIRNYVIPRFFAKKKKEDTSTNKEQDLPYTLS